MNDKREEFVSSCSSGGDAVPPLFLVCSDRKRFLEKRFVKTGKNLFMLVVFVFLTLCFFASCNTKYTESDLGESFRKIYDKFDTLHYVGIDIEQTGDNGYIILGEANEAPYLLRVDRKGGYMWDTSAAALEDYRYVVPGILIIQRETPGGQDYCFFCLKKTAVEWTAILLKFHEQDGRLPDQKPEEIPLSLKNDPQPEQLKPIHASRIGADRLLLLASDRDGENTLLIKMDTKGIILEEEVFPVSAHCFYAYPPTDSRLHITGKVENMDRYFFQTYKPSPSLHGFISIRGTAAEDCFMTAMSEVDGLYKKYIKNFSLAKPFIAMEWYVNTDKSVTLSGARIENELVYYIVNASIQGIDEYKGGELLPDLDETKPVHIQTTAVNGKKIVFFLSTARSDDVEIYAFDWGSSKFWGYMEINAGREEYIAAGLVQTRDSGLAILANTHIESRMGRICLFKLSREEVAAMEGQ